MKNKELIALLQEHGPEEEVVVVFWKIAQKEEKKALPDIVKWHPHGVGREVAPYAAQTAIYL